MTRILAAAFSAVLVSAAPAVADLAWTPGDSTVLNARIAEGEYGQVTSVLILQDGAVLHEGYYGEATAQTLHDTRSVTKTITGMAVGRAIGEGLITLETPVAEHFPDYAALIASDPRKAQITVRDLLTMSGPLECDDWNSFSRGNEERMYIVEDWTGFFWSLPARGYPYWQSPPSEQAYGRAFSYCTAGIQLLGELVERVSGEPFTEFVETRLFAPLGVEAFEWPRNGIGQAHMGGGLRLTTRDLAAFAELQRLGGVRDGEAILPADYVALSQTPHAVIPAGPGMEYGFTWWLQEVEGERVVMMNGNGGNRVMLFPDHGVTAVLTKTDYNTSQMHAQAAAFMAGEIMSRLR
jgi:CubicO group peptidase (beta-lactamase class C family)